MTIVYLFYRRSWIAAACLLLALAFLLIVLPAPFRGFDRAPRPMPRRSDRRNVTEV